MALGKKRRQARAEILRQAAAWINDIGSTYIYNDEDDDEYHNLLMEESRLLSASLSAKAKKLEPTI